jgi:hypothetical protein
MVAPAQALEREAVSTLDSASSSKAIAESENLEALNVSLTRLFSDAEQVAAAATKNAAL